MQARKNTTYGLAPPCLHCGNIASREVVKGRPRWACTVCPDSYVGCHPNSNVPLGYPCDGPTRASRTAAHAIMDPIWRNAPKWMRGIRRRLYIYLSVMLDLPPEKTHIGMFDTQTCMRAIEAVRGINARGIWDWYEAYRKEVDTDPIRARRNAEEDAFRARTMATVIDLSERRP